MTRRDLFRATIGALCGLALPWRKVEAGHLWRFNAEAVDCTDLAFMGTDPSYLFTFEVSHDGGKTWEVTTDWRRYVEVVA